MKNIVYFVLSVVYLSILMLSIIPYVYLLFCWIVVSTFLPKTFFHKVEDCMWGWYQNLVVFFFEQCTGVKVYVNGAIPSITENAVVISNHQCVLDWIVADFIALRQNMGGHMRYVFKNVLKYLPLYGFAFGVHGGVFVRRDGHYNAENMKKVLNILTERKATIYFTIYPEGTRFSPKKKNALAKSQNFAELMGLKKLNQVLAPRVKAFEMSLNCLQTYVNAVYDITIIYDAENPSNRENRLEPPSVFQFLSGQCNRVYVRFERVPIDEVMSEIDNLNVGGRLTEASGMMKWLHSRFVLKDELFESFYKKPEALDSVTDVSHSDFDDIGWKRTVLPFSKTFPSICIALLLNFAFLYYPLGRNIYIVTATLGTVLGMIYSHFRF